MRKNNEESLGSITKVLLKEYRLEEKIAEVKINTIWENVMGKEINRLTLRMTLKDKVLIVYLRSAPLREELSMGRTKIKGMLNKEFGQDIINEVIFR